MEPLTIRLKDCDVRLAVPPSLSSITTYILLEQERWFEEEWSGNRWRRVKCSGAGCWARRRKA